MNKYKIEYFVSFGLINLISLMLIFSALAFTVDRSITIFHFPVALAGSLFINYLAINNGSKMILPYFLKSSGWILLILVISIFIARAFYDITYDGQAYHMEAIIKLKEGWNPFKEEIKEPYVSSIWINHYGKGAEIPQAAIYTFTGSIETGKATNIILLIASFLLSVSFLGNITSLSKIKIFIISSLFALNPIAVSQVLSTYVDGQLASLLLCLLIVNCLLFLETNKYTLLLFASIIVLSVNIKFIAIGYIGIFIIALLTATLLWKKREAFKKVFIVASISSFIGIVLVGYNPYFTNTINLGHPFHPLAGKNKIDIMETNSPPGFENKGRFEKLAISIFSKTENLSLDSNKAPDLKIPFTFNKDEIYASSKVGIRIGGFGILFSGIFLFSLIIIFLLMNKKTLSREHRNYLIYIIFILIVSITIISESWWARYVPQLYLIPLVILLFAEFSNKNFLKYITMLLYLMIMINISIIATMNLRLNIITTMAASKQIDKFKTRDEELFIDWGMFRSNRIRFSENGIKFKEKDLSNANSFLELKHSTAKIENP